MKVCPVCSREYPDDIRFCQNDGTTLRAAAPEASLVGQVIADRYHIIKKLGEGGMGQVYLAEHVKMGRRCAIKVMSPAMANDPDSVARFNREAANASRISHSHVCSVYDFGETPEGLIYLAMEFVEGEPLTELLAREGALPPARATAIFKQTAEALQAAHDLGIVHRDLKPDNIMIARGRDGSDQVKVVDFGIAKAVGGDESGQKVTKTGLVVGTPEFMSPEQLSGDKVDGRSDLYSLALVYFRMLTGQLPFQAETVQETMIKRLTDDPAKLGETRPDLAFPAGLQEVIDAALVRTPAQRYQTVAKFADDVTGVVQLRRPSAGGATPATRAQPEMDDRTQLLDSKQTKAHAARRVEQKPRSKVPLVAGAVVLLGAAAGGYFVLKGGSANAGNGDTSQVVLQPESSKVGGPQAPDTAKHVTPTGGPTGNPTGGTRESTVAHPPQPSIDVSHAFDALDDMMMSKLEVKTNASWIRDSALKYFNATGITQKDKAYAAFVVGNAFFSLENRSEGCRWVRTAIQLDPSSNAYAGLASQCQD